MHAYLLYSYYVYIVHNVENICISILATDSDDLK